MNFIVNLCSSYCHFSELLKGHKIEDALHEASMAKKLEAEAIQALKELQAGLQANLNSDAVSIQKNPVGCNYQFCF